MCTAPLTELPAAAAPEKPLKAPKEPEPGPMARYFEGLSPRDKATEGFRFGVGLLIFAIGGPFVFFSALLSTLIEAADRGFDGGVFLSQKEQTGFILGTVAPWLHRKTHPYFKHFVKQDVDSYMVGFALLFGLVVPSLMVMAGMHTLRTGEMSWLLCLAYHQFRIGPFVMNFGYVYALSHREGHAIAANTGMWKPPLDKRGPLRYVFNYWIGIFFGIMPASFDVGHSIIHHKYSNDENDITTCADMPRDNWVSYVSYLPRFGLYSSNITTMIHFWQQGNAKHFNNTVIGTAWYIGFYATVRNYFGGTFALAYIGYPFVEQLFLLMMANWSWHVFLCPVNPTNENVLSTTILNGQINVLNEDAHVEHHRYPGAHWASTPAKLEKHRADYDDNGKGGKASVDDPDSYGSVFKNTHVFELGGMCMAGALDELAKRFVGFIPDTHSDQLLGVSAKQRHTMPDVPDCPLPLPVIEDLLRRRLRHCWFGPRAKVQGPKKVN